jgi:hypothetical protein
MKAKTTRKDVLELSAEEVIKIIKDHLQQHYRIEQIRPIIKTVYDGTPGDLGMETFMGYEITANVYEDEKEIKI